MDLEVLNKIPQTKIQIYANSLYDAMDKEGELIKTSQGDVKTWSGFLTKLSDSVQIPGGVRSRVIRKLADIGCIQIIDQGKRNTPSLVALLYPPTAEAWKSWQEDNSPLTNRPDPATLEAEVRSLISQLGGVDLKRVIVNFEERLQRLEHLVAKLLDSGEDN